MVCQLIPELRSWSVVITNLQVLYLESFFPHVGRTKTRMVDVHQTAICLIICNLLVIATYLYRVLGYQGQGSTSDTTGQDSVAEKDDLATSSSMPQQMTLTTIEHLFSAESGYSASAASDETVPKPTVSVTDSSC